MCKHFSSFLFSPAHEVLTEGLPPPFRLVASTSAFTLAWQVWLRLAPASSSQFPALSVGGDPVQLFKLDGGESQGPSGPAFVLRHRTLNVAEQRTGESEAVAAPMRPQSKGDAPTSGPSTSHLSASGCTSHNGVSMKPMPLVG